MNKLYQSLKGKVSFSPADVGIAFELTGDGLGHIEVKGTASDGEYDEGYGPIGGNTISFRFGIDQTELQKIIDDLRSIEEQFPVEGKLFGIF